MSSHRAVVALGDIIAIAVIVLLAVLPFPDETFRARGWLLVPALLPAVALLFRRRAPLAVLGAIVACDLLLAVNGVMGPSTLMGIAIAAFAVTDRVARVLAVTSVAVTVVIAFVANALVLGGDPFDSRAMQFLAFIAVGAALGAATRSRREYMAAMSERVERAERSREEEARRRVAEERVSIARDLHDVVAHQISVISLSAGVASSAIDSKPERAREALATIRSASRSVLADIGALLSVLRADDPDDLRTLHPQPGLADRAAVFDRFTAAGLVLEVRGDEALPALSPGADHAAYFVLWEGLTNAFKHGAEQRATVNFRTSAVALEITIDNPVQRRDPDPALSSGQGLRGLRERVAAARGTITAAPVPSGFRLHAVIPRTDGGA